jgi:Uma2 family endonuclease
MAERRITMNAARQLATYQDVLDAPEHVVAELIDGVLHTMPRPAPKHARASGRLLRGLDDNFDHGRKGPGGWIILIEPELHLDGNVLVPDVAGWRRERLPKLPDAAYFEIAPDWVCEVLSPATARFDRVVKLPLYAKAEVGFVWLVDPLARTLEIYQRQASARWLLLNTFADNAVIHPEPFDALPFELADLWAE